MNSLLDPNTLALLSQLGISPDTVETLLSGTLALTIVMLITAVPTGMIAKRKGRSVVLWVILALSVPVLPLLAVWLMPAVQKETRETRP